MTNHEHFFFSSFERTSFETPAYNFFSFHFKRFDGVTKGFPHSVWVSRVTLAKETRLHKSVGKASKEWRTLPVDTFLYGFEVVPRPFSFFFLKKKAFFKNVYFYLLSVFLSAPLTPQPKNKTGFKKPLCFRSILLQPVIFLLLPILPWLFCCCCCCFYILSV